jgi:hypothetical protein
MTGGCRIMPVLHGESPPMVRSQFVSTVCMACMLALYAAPAAAQDPAAVGSGRGDPALVGGGGWSGPARPAAQPPIGFGAFGGQGEGANDPQRAAKEVEILLQLVRGQLDGSRSAGTADGERADALRYRGDAETLIRRNWDKLGPLTRDLYASEYGRTHPSDNSQRYISPYGDNGQIENQQLGSARDAGQAMQNLEDLLLPMLQDLKQGFDAELRNRTNGR